MSKFIEPSNEEIKIEQLYKDMGLSDEEYAKVCDILGSEPNFTEIGIFSVMWSEHCSYKHSKPFLTQFPTSGEHVLMGPEKAQALLILVITKRLCLRLSHTITLLQLNHTKAQLLVWEALLEILFLLVHVQLIY